MSYASVAAPPTTHEKALRVAVEHVAFCPDTIWSSDLNPAEYAAAIMEADTWTFWWD
jgi:hypothetical protein